MLIRKEQTFAVAVDYQTKILPAMANRESLIEKSVRLFNGLKVLEVPVFITQQYTKGLGGTTPEITEAIGKEDWLEKMRYSGFEELKTVIPSPQERPNVLVTGIESHVCVLQTALELKDAGYRVYLVTDCVTSRSTEDRATAIERMKQEGILLTSYESILFELQERAGNDTAKQIQKIVR